MSEQIKPTMQEMVSRMEDGWNKLQAYLKTLSDEQLTKPLDDVGWSVKDHLTHIAAWANGITAVLKGQDRLEAMNVDQAAWSACDQDEDKENALIQSRNKNKSAAEVRDMVQGAHRRLVEAVQRMSDADLMRPYRSFDSKSTSDKPIWPVIVGNSYGHYEEHRPWIEAIVARGK